MYKFKKKIFRFEYEDNWYYYVATGEAVKITATRYKNNNLRFKGFYVCKNCNGSGFLNSYGDICYCCNGSGYTSLILKTTLNLKTAENRLIAEKQKSEDNFISSYGDIITKNLNKTISTYSNKFYLILDSRTHSTYKEKALLKSKLARWDPSWHCWWVKYSPNIIQDLKDFNLILINTTDVLTDFNKINKEIITKYVSDNNKEIFWEI